MPAAWRWKRSPRRRADGYTLYYFDSGPLTVAPHLDKVGYDNRQVVHAPRPRVRQRQPARRASVDAVQSVSDVIEASKREPNKWSYGTSGVGGPHHLSGEYFKSVTGANLLHVPYKGGGPAMTDLMGGQIPMLFSSLGPAVGAVKSGKIRAIAVTSLQALGGVSRTCRRWTKPG